MPTITQLPSTGNATGAEIPVWQSGVTRKIPASLLAGPAGPTGAASTVPGPQGPPGPAGPRGPIGLTGDGTGGGGAPAVVVRPEDYGAVGDANTDDAQAFRDALNALRSTNGILQGTSGKHYKLNSGITWWPAFASIDMRGCSLNFSSMVAPPEGAGGDIMDYNGEGFSGNFGPAIYEGNPYRISANGFTQVGKRLEFGAGDWSITLSYYTDSNTGNFNGVLFNQGVGAGQRLIWDIPNSTTPTTHTYNLRFDAGTSLFVCISGGGWHVTNWTVTPRAAGPDVLGFPSGPSGWNSNNGPPVWTSNPTTVAAPNGFTQVGKLVNLPAGTWDITVSYTSGTDGNGNGFALVLFNDGVGAGQHQLWDVPGGGPRTEKRTFTIDTPRSFYVSASGSNYTITDWTVRTAGGSVSPICRVAAITVSGDGAQYGADRNSWMGGDVYGPGFDSRVAAFMHVTYNAPNSSRPTRYNMNIVNFQVGDMFKDRAYAIHTFGSSYFNMNLCVQEFGGVDQGEVFAYYGCKFFNSGVAAENGGAGRLEFHGCHFDYCTRWFQGLSGQTYLYGGWMEASAPAYSAQTMIDVTGSGELVFFGTFIQFTNGSVTPANTALISVAGGGRITFKSVFAYNWQTSGALGSRLWTGDGEVMVDSVSPMANATFQQNTRLDRVLTI